jgi:DNA-binding transcriptional ArsR family regulator
LLNRSVEHIFNLMVDKRRPKRSARAQEERLNQAFQALSDPSRRQIVGLLREADELKVTDIAEAFSMSLNGVSKHLKVLERAGIVERRIDGREHWLRVHWEALQAPYEWLHFYQHFWTGRLDALVDYVKKQKGDSHD